MKNIFFTLLCVCFISTSILAQKDPKATEILTQLSSKTKAYSSIQSDFEYSVKSDDVFEEQKGSLILAGDKYKFSMMGITRICDGKSIAEIIPMDEEIILTSVNQNDPDEISPKEMFTLYEKGYKYRYIKETTIDGVKTHMIELYPDGSEENPYRRVVLYISVETVELCKVELFAKTSNKVFTFSLKNRVYNKVVDPKTFQVSCSIQPDYDCDDQRSAK